LKIIKN